MKKIIRSITILSIMTAFPFIVGCDKDDEMKVSYTFEVSNPYKYEIMINGSGICLDEGDRCKVITAEGSKSFIAKLKNPGDQANIYASMVTQNVPLGQVPRDFYPVSGGKYSWVAGASRVKNEVTGEYE